jgi:hypothetical protein
MEAGMNKKALLTPRDTTPMPGKRYVQKAIGAERSL